MQVVLGANGVIGRELARRLPAYADRVRLVSRTPVRVNDRDELVAADLLNAVATANAVAGAEIAYLVAGLKYDTRVWQTQWPIVMRNAIDACVTHGCRLVFFDNVYAYGRVDGAMTESTPYNPCSRKGEVRAAIATTFMEAVASRGLQGLIVRAADFYGPGATLSLTHATVTERLRAGKTPQWVGNPRAVHTFTYTPDAAETVARLGNRPGAFGEIWHAVTSPEAMTGEQYVRLACELAGRPYGLQVAPTWLLALMGLAMPVLRENAEMMYQFEHDYRFDSTKAAAALGMTAASYRDGIAATLRA